MKWMCNRCLHFFFLSWCDCVGTHSVHFVLLVYICSFSDTTRTTHRHAHEKILYGWIFPTASVRHLFSFPKPHRLILAPPKDSRDICLCPCPIFSCTSLTALAPQRASSVVAISQRNHMSRQRVPLSLLRHIHVVFTSLPSWHHPAASLGMRSATARTYACSQLQPWLHALLRVTRRRAQLPLPPVPQPHGDYYWRYPPVASVPVLSLSSFSSTRVHVNEHVCIRGKERGTKCSHDNVCGRYQSV